MDNKYKWNVYAYIHEPVKGATLSESGYWELQLYLHRTSYDEIEDAVKQYLGDNFASICFTENLDTGAVEINLCSI